MQKIIYITPHLSTGGLPQYLLTKIKFLKKENSFFEPYVLVWSDIGRDVFNVQKKQIQSLCPVYILDENSNQLFELIKKIQPNIIHFAEFPEYFLPDEVSEKIYQKDRNYCIIETTHDSSFNPLFKKHLPDKFVFVSPYSIEQFKVLNIPSELLEYPIDKQNRSIEQRFKILTELNLDPNEFHILNVGLWTSRKNQGEIIEYAKKLLDYPIKFHFVGNLADNFKDYWSKYIYDLPVNCIVWNERDDVDKFYSAMDLFLFTSRGTDYDKETNPIVVKEALSWQLPILMYPLDVYLGRYDNNDYIEYLDFDNLDKNLNLILKYYESFKTNLNSFKEIELEEKVNPIDKERLWSIGKANIILQKKSEFLNFLQYCYDKGLTDSILEIGSNHGGSTSIFCEVFKEVISIDLIKLPNIQKLQSIYPNLHFIEANSHNIDTFNQIKDKSFDVIFIDGSHSYIDIIRDFYIYAPLVKENGIIVFHDIITSTDNFLGQRLEVKKVFDKLKEYFETVEIIDLDSEPDSGLDILNQEHIKSIWGGIGIIINYHQAKKKQGIIVTSHSNSKFLKKCLESLRKTNILNLPITIIQNTTEKNEFEIGGIKAGINLYDEFLLLQDSIFIKNPDLFIKLFFEHYGQSVGILENYWMYFGKYLTDILKQIEIPTIRNKADAVRYERDFNNTYLNQCQFNYTYFYPESYNVSNRFEFYCDRQNMVIETEDFIKYKGTWSPSMVQEDLKDSEYDKPIWIFTHNYLVNDWELVVKNQFFLLKQYDLYYKCQGLFYHYYTESNEEESKFLDLISKEDILNKIKVIKNNENNFEIDALGHIKEFANQQNGYVLYFHTKGVASYYIPNHPNKGIPTWRKYIEYFNIARWQDCYDKLNEGYDVVGVDYELNYMQTKLLNREVKTIGANFFWANLDYIKTLDYPEKLNDRYTAERWILSNPTHRVYSFFESGCAKKIDFQDIKGYDLYRQYLPPLVYRNDYDNFVNEIWHHSNRFKIQQKESEWKSFLKFILTNLKNKESALEIGCYDTGTTYGLCEIFDRVISIDLYERELWKQQKLEHQNWQYFIGNSRDQKILNEIRNLGLKFDLIFIDGDHTEEGVEGDFHLYKEFLNEGGLIVFHDIVKSQYHLSHNCTVDRFWNRIKNQYEFYEFISNSEEIKEDYHPWLKKMLEDMQRGIIDNWGGIGVLKLIEKQGFNLNNDSNIDKLIHFQHCYLVNNWEYLLKEHLYTLQISGLYENLSNYILCYYTNEIEIEDKFIDLIRSFDTRNICQLIRLEENLFEISTLEELKKVVKKNNYAKTYYFYSHLKGVTSSQTKKGLPTWRRYLQYFHILNWMDCLKKLKEGYDVVGVDYEFNPTQSTRVGKDIYTIGANWFWSSQDYLEKLKSPFEFIKQDLHREIIDKNDCECWICNPIDLSIETKIYSFFESGNAKKYDNPENEKNSDLVDLYNERFSPKRYYKSILELIKYAVNYCHWLYGIDFSNLSEFFNSYKLNQCLLINVENIGLIGFLCEIYDEVNLVFNDGYDVNRYNNLQIEYQNLKIFPTRLDFQTNIKDKVFELLIFNFENIEKFRDEFLEFLNVLDINGSILFSNLSEEKVGLLRDIFKLIRNPNHIFQIDTEFYYLLENCFQFKDIGVVISTHLEDNNQINITNQCVDSLANIFSEIILTNHTYKTLENPNISAQIYDKSNPFIRHDYFCLAWFNHPNYLTHLDLRVYDNNLYHGLGVYINYYNGISYLFQHNINWCLCLNYDLIIDKRDYNLIHKLIFETLLNQKMGWYLCRKEQDGLTLKTIFFFTNTNHFLQNFKYFSDKESYLIDAKMVGSTVGLENYFYMKYLKNGVLKNNELILKKDLSESDFLKYTNTNLFSMTSYFSILPINGLNAFVVWYNNSNAFDKKKLKLDVYDNKRHIDLTNIDVQDKFRFYSAYDFKLLQSEYTNFSDYRIEGSISSFIDNNLSKVQDKTFILDKDYFDYLKSNPHHYFQSKHEYILVHLLTNPFDERELKSKSMISDFINHYPQILYIKSVNEPNKKVGPIDTCARPDALNEQPGYYLLAPGHYGCYLSHRLIFENILRDFKEEDFPYLKGILVCECDCGFINGIEYTTIKNLIDKAVDFSNEFDIDIFSFGPVNPEFIKERLSNEYSDCMISGRLIETHFYLVTKNKIQKLKSIFEDGQWDTIDLFYSKNLSRFGYFEKNYFAMQIQGISLLDNTLSQKNYLGLDKIT